LFRTLGPVAARWRPAEGNGLEHLDLKPSGDNIVADGVIIGERGGLPYGARYRILCDAAWVTIALDIECTDGRHLHLASDGHGAWSDGQARALPELDGCIDVDLAGSPFTNTLPIRRCDLRPETGPIEFRMVYVPFRTFEPAVDEQRYRCLAPGLYRYEAIDRTFTADLTVDEDGLVVDYPSLFHRVPL
jgi:hypothetical protein